MGSKWRKAKLALGLNMCLYVPQKTVEDDNSSPPRSSDVAKSARSSTTPTPSSSGLRLSKSGAKSSKMVCAICLTNMKAGDGHAIFMAECSHSFHFHCITSNVKHGNQICPVCRAKWKEIPFQSPTSSIPNGPSRMNAAGMARDDAWMSLLRQLPPSRLDVNRQASPLNEPAIYDDDDTLEQENVVADRNMSTNDSSLSNYMGRVKVKTYPETSAVMRSSSQDNFTVLVHLKAPFPNGRHSNYGNPSEFLSTPQRAPVDLVTVLDVSGSMAGTKLALLKRAMGFVIQNLGPSDRLSVVAFSSTARRIIALRRMTEVGKQEALLAVNSLTSNGGTNIAEGLRKGAKAIVDRKWKNPVASIILLSDGQDTYSVNSPQGNRVRTDYKSLLPISIQQNGGAGSQLPVHSFGFGSDHDAASMHSISENSGGTFSFIEAEGVIQDAFAQCIGGLLSVVVQELQVKVECVHPALQISSIKAGSYKTNIVPTGRMGTVDVGDLYAEEERDFLVMINVPVDESSDETSLLHVKCYYKDPITKDTVTLEEASQVKIQRPSITGEQIPSMEVDKQKNRLNAAEAMAEARVAAESGDLARAVTILENCSKALSESVSAQSGDRLCAALYSELKEMQERMANRQVYESSGRAYVLSGLSSHSWQRATARGDSTDSTSLVQAYQTSSMVDMLTRSQTMMLGNPSSQRKQLRQALSFPATRLQPR